MDIGTWFSLASIGTYIVERCQLEEALRAARGTEVDITAGTTIKRHCVRLLGALVDEASTKLKGVSSFQSS
jgi:hypothetical protein